MIVDLLRLCRPYYAVPMSMAYLLTVYYARGGNMAGHWLADGLSAAATMLVISAAYVLNDLFDLASDRVNAPHRPIAAGKVSRKLAGVWGGALTVAGLALATERWPFLPALTAVAVGLLLYNAFSKRLGWAKPLLVAAMMTSIYPLALAQADGAAGPRAWSLAVFPAWLFPTAFAYELLKDIRDIPGDRVAAADGLVHRHPRRWRLVANVMLVAPCVLLIWPFLLGCRWIYLAGAAMATGLAVASTFQSERHAIGAVYGECLILAVSAAVDVMVFGV
jgi:4-hydroxybenzoate polyprenyltransferase